MPVLELLESPLGPAVTLAGDGRLLDVCDEARAPLAFSCRSANCGTCLVAVIAGAEWLEPARADELEVLAALDVGRARPAERLACQVSLRPGPGLVRLRWVGARCG